MNAKARTARQTIKVRRKAAAAEKNPHTLASHARRAGLDGELATGIAGALRGYRKRTGVFGKAVRMFRTNKDGQKLWRQPVKGSSRFTRNEFVVLVTAYRPRVERYVVARQTLLSYAAI